MATVLITGANRGIGLELVKRFLKEGWQAHACARYPDQARELQRLALQPSLSVHQLEIGSEESLAQLRQALRGEPIDLLINNAGLAGDKSRQAFGDMDYAGWLELFRINTLGPMQVMEALIENLEAGAQKHVVNISSDMASISGQEGYMLAYSSSKTAMNSVMKSLASVLKPRGIRVNMMSPGWVRTDMGGEDAPLSPSQCADILYENISALEREDSGLFLGLEGNILPW